MRYILTLSFLFSVTLLSNIPTFAQTRTYLVQFTDKNNSTFSVNRPQEFLSQRAIDRRRKQNIPILERDLPVNQTYIEQVRQAGAKVLYPTRWMNGIVIEADQATLDRVNRLSFVRNNNAMRLTLRPEYPDLFVADAEIKENNNSLISNARTEENYGNSLRQSQMIGIDAMHQDGFRGEGIVIAVIDDGFQGVNTNPLFRQMNILGTYNFVRNTPDVYNVSVTHGARVLSTLAAYQDGGLIGTAHKASYYLFVTEIDSREDRSEEAFWLVAAERADSLGVDIISTSLGYTTFDDPTLNYTPNDLDGKTALVSQAAAIAVRTGMIVVKSAGNNGLRAWQKVSFPGDVDSVLTVGAVDANGTYFSQSGRGRTADGRIKPDVVAMGVNTVVALPNGNLSTSSGTSFAAPLVAGLAAGLWQANPSFTNMQIVNIIRRSGNRFNNPSDSLGYGIPNYTRAKILTSTEQSFDKEALVEVYPNPLTSNILKLKVRFTENQLNRSFQIRIFDALGRLCWDTSLQRTQQSSDTYELDISKANLSNGSYFLHIAGERINKTLKISIIQ
ncbi:S8 family serine peptidase [Thermoflexibacter ruber]|uniref:Por secretion system C-terminal sorting domain-containing protein n=1 Tax=Thermoflexibacter ruber TaxID=1003 RepID=A0A1I2JCD8_9BACT|nr:S8 family serine peptidase [Thermoflexibacter ruber]SFF50536.1 Por secretion system C-terminal sorting domain-containing protein [Thermoflexibacter ruber]